MGVSFHMTYQYICFYNITLLVITCCFLTGSTVLWRCFRLTCLKKIMKCVPAQTAAGSNIFITCTIKISHCSEADTLHHVAPSLLTYHMANQQLEWMLLSTKEWGITSQFHNLTYKSCIIMILRIGSTDAIFHNVN